MLYGKKNWEGKGNRGPDSVRQRYAESGEEDSSVVGPRARQVAYSMYNGLFRTMDYTSQIETLSKGFEEASEL